MSKRNISNITPIEPTLEIKFKNRKISNGQELPLILTQTRPTYSFPLEPNKYYSFIIVDPDAPVGFWIHYCLVNITTTYPGYQYYVYNGPNPPQGTGKHRYYCILYEQSKKTSDRLPISDTRAFGDYNMFKDLLGVELVAITYKYFVCEYGKN